MSDTTIKKIRRRIKQPNLPTSRAEAAQDRVFLLKLHDAMANVARGAMDMYGVAMLERATCLQALRSVCSAVDLESAQAVAGDVMRKVDKAARVREVHAAQLNSRSGRIGGADGGDARGVDESENGGPQG